MIISVKAITRAKQQKILLKNNQYLIYLKSPRQKGKANSELIDLLSDYFKKPKKYISIRSGLKSNHKLIRLL